MGLLRPVKERLLEKIVKDDNDCWIFIGCRTAKGYGHIGYQGRMIMTHRMSWQLHKGPIPEGILVLHKCDNPPCCNPEHLFLGTHQDNVSDRDSKGRQANKSGMNCPTAFLSDEDVYEIRRLLALGTMTQSEIGTQFRITQANVSSIKCRHTWSHLPEEAE